LLVIAFDEGGSSQSADGHHIVTIVVGAGVSPGTVSQTVYNHYNVLRTIQEGLGLPCLARSCKADTMADLFVGPSAEGSP
jgi:acid phosphatase